MLPLLLILALPFMFLYGTWAWAFVIQKAWLWLAVPAFALNPLTFAQAIAISVLTGILFFKSLPKHDTKKKESGETDWNEFGCNLVYGLVAPWVILLLSLITAVVFI